ncbi:MAG: VWA domain-containing protein [Bacillota bacterium]
MHHKFVIYPFAAIVGQELMKKALLVNAVDPAVGGVLVKGDKGTGKSTAVRALADLLGEIRVVKGCPFNCHPENKKLMCKACQEQLAQKGRLSWLEKKMEIVDMPLSATEDMVIGSINIKKALKEGSKALEPGLLARANRNVLYIDEVNLLDDHLVNILLDAAAMGVNVVEREGISLYHPARFILIGTMNPEEGELRPQIMDRFGLSVEISALVLPEERLQVLENRRMFDQDPFAFEQEFYPLQDKFKESVFRAREILPLTVLSRKMLLKIVQLTTSLGIKTHRADIVMEKTSRVLAALEGRSEVREEDIKEAAFLALPHRMRQDPMQKGEHLSRDRIEKLLYSPEGEQKEEQEQDQGQTGGEEIEPLEREGTLQSELVRFGEAVRGRGRDDFRAEGKRGQFVKARPNSEPDSLAVDATLRRAVSQTGKLEVLPEHLMEKVRVSRGKALYLILMDASSSMRMERKIKLAKTLSWQLLQHSYQKKNRVGLLAFRGEEARVLVHPTGDVLKIDEALQALPTGGKTPLTPAIFRALEFAVREREARPVIVVISDGKANVFVGESLEEDLERLQAKLIPDLNFVMVNTESRKRSLGVLEKMAQTLGAAHFYLEEILNT